MSHAPTVKLHVLAARDSSRAAILRQGSAKLWRLILWDRADDGFHDGQWVRHKIYPERCDLSADGEHFLFFGYRPHDGGYTAISRPPFLTALAVWHHGGTRAGGGVFLGRRHVAIGTGPAEPVQRARLDRWRVDALDTGAPEVVAAYADRDARLLSRARIRPEQMVVDTDAILAARGTALPGVEVDGPRLCRLVDGRRRLVRDFSDMAFEDLRAPYASARETEPRWHPLREGA